MKSNSVNFDKTAIGLSLACAVHCLLLPVILTIMPALATNAFGSEHFHQWMLIAVLPTSLMALTIGCRKHRQPLVLILGLLGLAVLTLTTFFAHDLIGEAGERVASLIGVTIIAASHWRNHTLCQRANCDCEITSRNTSDAQ